MTRRWAVLLFGAVSLLLAASARPSADREPVLSLRYTFDGWWVGSVPAADGRHPLHPAARWPTSHAATGGRPASRRGARSPSAPA